MKFCLINDFILYFDDQAMLEMLLLLLLLVHTFHIDKNQQTAFDWNKNMLAHWELETMHKSRADQRSERDEFASIDWVGKVSSHCYYGRFKMCENKLLTNLEQFYFYG